jgi:hypothetical protein
LAGIDLSNNTFRNILASLKSKLGDAVKIVIYR